MVNLLVMAFAACFFVGAGDALKEHTLDNGRIRVLLPGVPVENYQKASFGPAMKNYTSKTAEGMFVVGSMDVPDAVGQTEEQIKMRLDAGKDQCLVSTKGKLLKETSIKLADKYYGRELLVELPAAKEVLRSRYYLVDGRLYLLMVIGKPEFINSETCEKFLDSLKVGK
jgi:hypothetical protein